VRLGERSALELTDAIEAHDWAHHNITHLELLPDATRGAGGQHQLRLDLMDDLLPDIDVRQLGPVLRHMRIGFEHEH
jgi:hypothetical protein